MCVCDIMGFELIPRNQKVTFPHLKPYLTLQASLSDPV